MQSLKGNSLLNLLNWELKLELLKSHSCRELTQKKAEKTKSQANEDRKTKDNYI